MEREGNKRGREQEEEEKDWAEKAPKKQDLSDHGISNIKIEDINHDVLSSYELPHADLGFGVFDFPWLKEGMISKSEDLHLEDTFSSFLQDTYTNVATELSGQYCFCESPSTLMASTDFAVDKFEENVWSLEMEGMSSVLNQQPLQQEGV
ncbi:hypothetical protein K2173_009028 [Erythroxylum novogranatense]|uniref:Uncharacterized protein n=1 Tax=Erythroxylum novogranatense TaxID=1862640 RepID=A0AAV8TSK1_9ROSI|nr:hypothetical protein K2173_009028 [Erythroxylum novogranatense]